MNREGDVGLALWRDRGYEQQYGDARMTGATDQGRRGLSLFLDEYRRLVTDPSRREEFLAVAKQAMERDQIGRDALAKIEQTITAESASIVAPKTTVDVPAPGQHQPPSFANAQALERPIGEMTPPIQPNSALTPPKDGSTLASGRSSEGLKPAPPGGAPHAPRAPRPPGSPASPASCRQRPTGLERHRRGKPPPCQRAPTARQPASQRTLRRRTRATRIPEE